MCFRAQILPCGWATWILNFGCLKAVTVRPLHEEQVARVSEDGTQSCCCVQPDAYTPQRTIEAS